MIGERHPSFRKFQIATWSIYAVVFAVFLALIVEISIRHAERHIFAYFISAMFVLLAVPTSFLDMVAHLLHYSQPDLQRYVIRILLMVPIYSIESWFALRFRDSALYFATARECYESLAIHAFFKLLEGYLIKQGDIVGGRLKKKDREAKAHMPFPGCWLKPWNLHYDFFRNCRIGVFQYVIIHISTSLTTFFLQIGDVYGDGEIVNFKVGYPYVTIVNNLSQLWAMYCLILFYHELKVDLAGLNPLPKLLCIKGVVFFTFWQSMIIAVLGHYKLIKPTLDYSVDEIDEALANFLICVEMLVAAYCHHKYFPWNEMHKDAPPTRNVSEVLKDWVPRDLAHEVVYAIKGKRPKRQDSLEILEAVEGLEIDDKTLVDDAVEITVTASRGQATGEAKDAENDGRGHFNSDVDDVDSRSASEMKLGLSITMSATASSRHHPPGSAGDDDSPVVV